MQMKILDVRIMRDCLVVTKVQYFMGICVSEVVMVNQIANKETEKQNILPNFSFFTPENF